MSWYFKQQNIILEENFGPRIVTELYLGGMNNIPRFFLEEDELYGSILNGNQLAVSRDKFYRVAGTLRERVKYDAAFRLDVKKRTMDWLARFGGDIKEFEQRSADDEITAEWIRDSLYLHRDMLALTEFNGMISYEYFRQKLEEICRDCELLHIEDFTHSFFLSHRLQLRKAKLEFVRNCMKNGNVLNDEELDIYIRNFNCLDPEHSPLTRDPAAEREAVIEEFTDMINNMDVSQVEEEINLINENHNRSLKKYQDNLVKVYNIMISKNYSFEEINNLIGGLGFISFACAEEEYRHFLQDHYWVLLGKLIRKLELPLWFISVNGLITAVKQRLG